MKTPRLKAIPAIGFVTHAQVDIVLSHNLACFRHREGLTQQQLADRLAIKRCSLGAYEEGRAEPPITVLLRYTRAFGLTLDTLLAPF